MFSRPLWMTLPSQSFLHFSVSQLFLAPLVSFSHRFKAPSQALNCDSSFLCDCFEGFLQPRNWHFVLLCLPDLHHRHHRIKEADLSIFYRICDTPGRVTAHFLIQAPRWWLQNQSYHHHLSPHFKAMRYGQRQVSGKDSNVWCQVKAR